MPMDHFLRARVPEWEKRYVKDKAAKAHMSESEFLRYAAFDKQVTVIGAGMAGCEAAWQLVKRGIPVKLIEMKPVRRSAAHTGDGFAELVCSNSLKAENLTSGSGLLKAEMKERRGVRL